MRNTSLCYITQNGKYLMLHRVKKENDENHDKWIGIGGKFQEGESPEECVRREALEETGLELLNLRFRGIVTFVSDEWGTEYMHLFTSDSYGGDMKLPDCEEGVLEWVDKSAVTSLSIWQGDKIFFQLLNRDVPFFSLKLRYRGDTLQEAILNERPLDILNQAI